MVEALPGTMGVDLTAIPTIEANAALPVAAEIGPGFSTCPSWHHFSSWLGPAPGTRISCGKSLPGPSPKVQKSWFRGVKLTTFLNPFSLDSAGEPEVKPLVLMLR